MVMCLRKGVGRCGGFSDWISVAGPCRGECRLWAVNDPIRRGSGGTPAWYVVFGSQSTTGATVYALGLAVVGCEARRNHTSVLAIFFAFVLFPPIGWFCLPCAFSDSLVSTLNHLPAARDTFVGSLI